MYDNIQRLILSGGCNDDVILGMMQENFIIAKTERDWGEVTAELHLLFRIRDSNRIAATVGAGALIGIPENQNCVLTLPPHSWATILQSPSFFRMLDHLNVGLCTELPSLYRNSGHQNALLTLFMYHGDDVDKKAMQTMSRT